MILKVFKNVFLCAVFFVGFVCSVGINATSAFAHSPTYSYEGLFAGSMICPDGEIGVLFHIEENGPITRGEFDRVNGVCRSGSGSCNDSHDLKYAGTQKIKGTLDFFPTAANPKVQLRTFELEGTGTRQESERQSKMAVTNSLFVSKYLEFQSVVTPDFPADLSGIHFKITIENPRALPPYDKMFSRVNGHQCDHLTLSRIEE